MGTLRREIDRPLRRDVRFLGRVLGEVLLALEGPDVLALEERVRKLAIRRRRGPRAGRPAAGEELAAILGGLPLGRAEAIVRAFSAYFQLVNLAEQHHRIRRARAHARRPGEAPQRGSLAAILERARAAGVPASRVREAIASLEVTLTLTAHPTQPARRTILEKRDRIAHLLEERDRCRLTPHERADARRAIREEVTALWLTDEVRRERPTVADEVRNALWYTDAILRGRIPELNHGLAMAFERAYGEPLGISPTPLRVHSWVGGDMDGNPAVTPGVLEDALRAYEAHGLASLLRDVSRLGGELSQSARYVTVPGELADSIAADAARMPEVAARFGPGVESEPFRHKLRFVQARLAARLAVVEARRARARLPGGPFPGGAYPGGAAPPEREPPHAYRTPAELAADLEVLATAAHATGGADAGERRLRELLVLVRAQGFHAARLELRVVAEDARAGAAAIGGGPPDAGGLRLLEALRRIAVARAEGGEGPCDTLILSMTQGAGDVLAALRCAREAGLWDADRGAAAVDVVPLFETHAALDGAPGILQELFADPVYLRHARVRGVQEVMIGYSDSGKEVGLLAASAALRRAQRAVAAAGARVGLPVRLFHGRGESVARGGGPAQGAILALPAGTVAGRYKATEQGEALDQKYGRPELATRTLELVVGGALLHTLDAQERPPPEDEARYAAAFDELAETGRRAYRALVWEEPRFVEFFGAATPIDEIAKLPIGSRPSKRKQGGVEALRAIPWVFAWTQTRAILPGFYGVGSALEAAAARPGGEALLAEMYRAWPFFRAVIDNVEQVLAKCDFAIAARYAALAPAPAREAVWPRLRAEFHRTRRAVKRIAGRRRLLDGNPPLQRSIALRNPYVDPLSYLQIDLLQRHRGCEEACDRPLLLTLTGIAAGMRNTG
jgi:phosphoenolpyruvate carboxylase